MVASAGRVLNTPQEDESARAIVSTSAINVLLATPRAMSDMLPKLPS